MQKKQVDKSSFLECQLIVVINQGVNMLTTPQLLQKQLTTNAKNADNR